MRLGVFDKFGLRGGLAQALSINGTAFARVGPKITELVLIVVFAYLLAQTIWAVVAPSPAPIGDIARAPVEKQNLPEVASNPFPSTSAGELAAAPQEIADVAETTLDLTLTGVWASDEAASAVIKLPDGKQNRFVVGDTVVSGVTLDAVYSNQVVLSRNGVREALKFEKKLDSSGAGPGRGAVSQRGAGDLTRAAPAGLAEILRLAPATDQSGALSVQIYAARNRAAFNALGFRNGDKLVSVDGTPAPTDPAQLAAILGQIQRAETAQIVVDRGGEKVTLNISLKSLGVLQ